MLLSIMNKDKGLIPKNFLTFGPLLTTFSYEKGKSKSQLRSACWGDSVPEEEICPGLSGF